GYVGGDLVAAPEDVRAHGTDDGPARVLRDDQAPERRVGRAAWAGRGRVDPQRRRLRDEVAIDGDGAARREDHALRASRALAGGGLEEDVRGVGIHDRVGAVRVGQEVGADRLHRDRLVGELALVDERPPDGRVALAVAAGGADAHLLAGIEEHAARALDLHEE